MFNFPKDFPQSSEIADSEHPNVIELGGQTYLFAAVLDNGDQNIELQHKNLHRFVLHDSLVGFGQSGELEFAEDKGGLHSAMHSILGKFCKFDGDEETTKFAFRGSGNEKLHIKMLPIQFDQETGDIIPTSNDFRDGDWLIMQTYTIVDIKTLPTQFGFERFNVVFESIESHVLKNNRLKTFNCGVIGNLHEVGNQKGYRNQSNYGLYPEPQSNKKENVAAAKTGEAIYSIIRQAYNEYSETTNYPLINRLPKIMPFNGSGDYTVDYKEELKDRKTLWDKKNDNRVRSTDKAPYDVWDFGKNESILLTSLGKDEMTIDLIYKFLDVHVSEQEDPKKPQLELPDQFESPTIMNVNGDPCILKINQPRTEKGVPKITLRPIISYLENMASEDGNFFGDEYMESFMFKSDDTITDKSIGVLKGLIPNFNFCGVEKGKEKLKISPIKKYEFDPIKPQDSDRFLVSHEVNYVGGSTPTKILTDGNFRMVKRYMGVKYLKYFLPNIVKDSNMGEGHINVSDDTNLKEEGNNAQIINSFIPTQTSFVALGRNRLIKNIIFMNDALTFRTNGSIYRKSGKFFGVDKSNGVSDPNDENLNRILGVYWAAHITHELDFRDKTYINEITGVKFYRHKEPKVNE